MPESSLSRRRFLKLAGACFGLGLAASYPVAIERYAIVTSHYRIPVPNLAPAFSGLRIVHLSDLHLGPLVPLSIIRWVIARTNRIPRDLVLCTGDYVRVGSEEAMDEPAITERIAAVWGEMGRLSAPLGVHSVLGNHDHWASTALSQSWLERTGQDLRHKTRRLERGGQAMWLAGAGDLWEDHRPLDEVLTGIPEPECRIALAHNPDTADSDFRSRVDLMLSGHTHGGQVVLPGVGAAVLPVRNKTYSSGMVTSPRGMKVFISRGIGWAVLPVRFNCLPEIAVLELVAALAGVA